MLEIDREAIAEIRATLDRVQLDAALQGLRPDAFTSPYPNPEEIARFLPALDSSLAVAIRLLSLAAPVSLPEVESTLGRPFVEAALICGLVAYDDAGDTLSTDGVSIVSRLGQYFVVSINSYYPSFDPSRADVYMGPDSFSLAHEIQRRWHLVPAEGRALDLCTGSGIAGLSVARFAPHLRWTGVDLAPDAVATARFNAHLNGCDSSFETVESDLYSALGDTRYDLIVANPPFIPVPTGLDFPGYGAGGEDGLLVLAPMLAGLPEHLTPRGSALIYAEGIGRAGRLLVEDLFPALTSRGLDIDLTVIANTTIDNALYTLGVMLSKQRPSRLPEIVHWRDLFARLHVDQFAKFFIQATPGSGSVTKRSVSPDPRQLAAITAAST